MPHPANKPSITQQKLAMRLLGPAVSAEDARVGADRLEPHLPTPSAAEFLAPDRLKRPASSLLRPSRNPDWGSSRLTGPGMAKLAF